MKRIPRPYGLTAQAKQRNKETLINHAINQYVNNNYTWNHVQVSIQYIAQCLDITERDLIKRIALKVNKMTKLINPEAIQTMALDLNFMALKNLTEVRYGMSEQLSLLLSAQGGKYKPFISDTVIRMFSELSKHDQGYLTLAKNLMPQKATNTTNILNQVPISHTPNELGTSSPILTISSAISLIQEAVPPLLISEGNEDTIGLLSDQEKASLPEVRANYQGVSDKDGITEIKINVQE